jgi:ketosteroid isomerase-like protein
MENAIPADTSVLADKVEIKERLYEFYYRCDDGDVSGAIAQFATDDVSFDAGSFGRAEGSAAWQEWAVTDWEENVVFTRHLLHNPVIDVDGDSALGTCYYEIPSITADGDAVWLQGTYEYEFRRVDGEWKCSSYTVRSTYATPYDQGWAKQPFIEGVSGELDW